MKKTRTLLLLAVLSTALSLASSSEAAFKSEGRVQAEGAADTIALSHKQGFTNKTIKAGASGATAVVIENTSSRDLTVDTELTISKALPKGVTVTVNGQKAFVGKTKETYTHTDLKPKSSSEVATYDVRIQYDKAAYGEYMDSGTFTLSAKSVGKLKNTNWKTKPISSSATITYTGVNTPLKIPVIYKSPTGKEGQPQLDAKIQPPGKPQEIIKVLNSKGVAGLDEKAHAKGVYYTGTLSSFFADKLNSVDYSGPWANADLGIIIPDTKGGNAKLVRGSSNQLSLLRDMRDILNRSDGKIHLVKIPKKQVTITSDERITNTIILKDDKGNIVDEIAINGTSAKSKLIDTYDFNVNMPMSKVNNFDYTYKQIVGAIELKEDNDKYDVTGNFSTGLNIKKAKKPTFKFSLLDDGSYSVDGFVEDLDEAIAENGLDPNFRYNPIIPSEYRGKLVTEIGASAFSRNELSSVVIPNSVSSIGEAALERNQLTSVDIPDSVTEIGDIAFQKNKLTSVDIPNSVTEINYGAFRDNQLTSVNIPDSVTKIGKYSFGSNQLTSLDIPNSVTTIGAVAFASNRLTSLVIPDSVTEMDFAAFEENKLKSVVIPNSLTQIEFRAFRFNEIESVDIPDSITKVGSHSFDRNKLTSVNIPDSVTELHGSAFSNNELTSIDIPNSVTEIGYRTFYNNKFTSIDIPNSVTEIGGGAFAWNQLTSAIIPDSVTKIGSEAFDNNQLTSVVIPNSVTTIEKKTFFRNRLTSIDIPNSVTEIGTGAFSENSLTSVKIPNSVTKIEYQAFLNNKLTSVKIPDSMTKIEEDTFRKNELTSVVIPDSVTYIGDSAFRDNQLTSLNIPNSVTKIENYAFIGNKLTSLVIPDSMTEIGYTAFEDNQLTSIVIPDSLTKLGYKAFDKNPGGTVYANLLKNDSWPTLRTSKFDSVWSLKPLSQYKP